MGMALNLNIYGFIWWKRRRGLTTSMTERKIEHNVIPKYPLNREEMMELYETNTSVITSVSTFNTCPKQYQAESTLQGSGVPVNGNNTERGTLAQAIGRKG